MTKLELAIIIINTYPQLDNILALMCYLLS